MPDTGGNDLDELGGTNVDEGHVCVITTQGRRGTFVASPALDDPEPTAIGTARKAALSFAEAARRSGLSLPEATRLVEATWPRTTS